jgi:hypothetical protein
MAPAEAELPEDCRCVPNVRQYPKVNPSVASKWLERASPSIYIAILP